VSAEHFELHAGTLAVRLDCDVLVIGGGTAGTSRRTRTILAQVKAPEKWRKTKKEKTKSLTPRKRNKKKKRNCKGRRVTVSGVAVRG